MLPRQITSSERLLATPVIRAFDARNSSFFNILCANYFLAIFYADFFRHRGDNSCILKDLEVESGLFFTPDRSTKKRPTSHHGKLGNPGPGKSSASEKTKSQLHPALHFLSRSQNCPGRNPQPDCLARLRAGTFFGIGRRIKQ